MMARAVTADFRNNSSASTVSELAWFLKGAACHTSIHGLAGFPDKAIWSGVSQPSETLDKVPFVQTLRNFWE